MKGSFRGPGAGIILSGGVSLLLLLGGCATQAQTGLCELSEEEVWQYTEEDTPEEAARGDSAQVIAQSGVIGRSDLVARISQSTGLPPSTVSAVLTHYETHLKDTLASGKQVRLANFGAFRLIKRKARTGTKPGTTQPIAIPAATTVAFKAYKPLYCGVDPAQTRCR